MAFTGGRSRGKSRKKISKQKAIAALEIQRGQLRAENSNALKNLGKPFSYQITMIRQIPLG